MRMTNLHSSERNIILENAQRSLQFFFTNIENDPLIRLQSESSLDATQYSQQKKSLASFEQSIASCVDCGLHASRTKFVFGAGNPNAKICFVGVQPSAEDEASAIPFQGASGNLLEKMIQAMGLQKENVYLLNIIKCRPPNNRTPQENEIDACIKHALKQIELINPICIVALGELSAQALLRTNTPLHGMRAKIHQWNECRLIATHHPEELLKNNLLKKPTWADLQLAMQILKN